MRHSKDPRVLEVLRFWFGEDDEYGKRRKQWFAKNAAFDVEIRERFLTLYDQAARGALDHWQSSATDCLARVLTLDQLPRNMFRGTARAFATDARALAAARHAVTQGYDRDALPVERLFFYLPFEHSESLADQERCCELSRPLAAFAETADALGYAERHREIIARFGRFPHRNAALGRTSTPAELAFLAQPGSGF